MPRIYPFINALRLRQNIIYPIPEIEGENLYFIAIAPWIELVNKYTQLKLSTYSPEDMIKRYIIGELTIDRDLPTKTYIKDKVEISNVYVATKYMQSSFNGEHITNEYLTSYLVDDVVYDSADSWYISYGGSPISREVLFNYKDKSHWNRNIASNDKIILQKCTDIFIEFCFKELKRSEIYCIVPIRDTNDMMLTADKIIDINKDYKKYIYINKYLGSN